jgi:WD40 repeat protein
MLSPDATLRGRYRITYVIDERPGGQVYRARDEQTGQLVLLGALPAPDNRAREGTALLARQLGSVAHPALLPLTDSFAEGPAFYAVCPDPGGQDLERFLRAQGGPLAEAEVLGQARGLIDLLERLHDQRPPLLLGELWVSDLWVAEGGAWRLPPFPLLRPISTAPSPYRAPELAHPDAEPDRATDTYAVCALLYHALTGAHPPTAEQRLAGAPLTGPRSLNPALSALLEQALLRGLEQRPPNRYQSARELRLALETVQMMGGRSLGLGPDVVPAAAPTPQPAADGPAAAAPDVPPPPAAAAPPRRRGLSTGCLVSLGAGLLVVLFGFCLTLVLLVPRVYQFAQTLGRLSALTPAPTRPAEDPVAAPALGETSPARPTAAAPGPSAITPANVAKITSTLELTTTLVGPAQFAPGGEVLALGINDTISLRSADLSRELRSLRGSRGSVFALAFSPDGRLLASSATGENVLRVWDVASGRQVQTLSGHTGWVRGLAFSPDGKLLASGSVDNSIRLWDTASAKVVRTLSGHTDWLGGVAFAPDGASLVSASRDGTVRLWDVASGSERAGFSFKMPGRSGGETHWSTAVAFAPDGKQIAVGGTDNLARLIDAQTGKVLHELRGHTDWIFIRGLAYTPDGQTLLTASLDGSVRAWNPANGTELDGFEDRPLRLTAIAVSADSRRLVATSDEEGDVILWDLATRKRENRLMIGRGLALGLNYSADGSVLGSISINGKLQFYEFEGGRQVERPGYAPLPQGFSFLPNRNLVMISDQHKLVLFGGADADELSGVEGEPLSLVVSADGRQIVVGDSAGKIGVWTPGTAKVQRTLESKLPAVIGLAISADGKLLAAAGPEGDPRIEVWDLASGKLLHTLGGMVSSANSLMFQPGGAVLAAVEGRAVRLWDARSGEMQREIKPSQQQISFTVGAFSPDGSMVAVGSAGGDLSFFDAGSGKPIASLRSGGVPVSLAFSPDGQQLAVSQRSEKLAVSIFALPKRGAK